LRVVLAVACLIMLLSAAPAVADEVVRESGMAAATAAATPDAFSDIAADPRKPEIILVAGRRILQGCGDGTFKPNGTVTEKDFLGILDRLIVACPAMTKPNCEFKNPDQVITRLRAVIVLIRAVAEKDALDSIADPKITLARFVDMDRIPDWGRKQAAFAIEKGYMRVETKFRPDDPITRSELAEILARCLTPSALQPNQPDAKYTGLVVDCTQIDLCRSMSPALISEDGTQIYPDTKHLPSIEFMEDQGLVSYVTDLANSKRCGQKPLTVTAVKTAGAAKHIAVVSDADRDAIMEAEKECHFFANWNVTFLMPAK